MAEAMASGFDPAATLRSRKFVGLLVIASIVGVVISFAAWGFLELTHDLQQWLFTDLSSGLGFDSTPWWWPLPILVIAGFPVAWAVQQPGRGGHVPAEGLKMSPTTPNMLVGIVVASVVTLGFGVVLGPEAPLIALGSGLTLFLMKEVKKDTPQQALTILAAAGSFAAISMIFQSPIAAAILIIEATGLGGPTLPLVLLPGLLAAGLGSLTFIGISHWAALDTSAYSLVPLALPHFPAPTWVEIGWSVVLAVVAAVLIYVVRAIGMRVVPLATAHPYVTLPVGAGLVAVLAIVFDQLTDHGVEQVLFSGQDQLPGLVSSASTWSAGALALVFVCKGLAWGISLGTFRGGPTFPAIYLGAAGGLLAAHLPGLSTTPAVAVGMTAMMAAMLRLPLSSIVIATILTIPGGAGSAPLIIVASVTAYLVALTIDGRHAGPDDATAAAAAPVTSDPPTPAT